MPCSGNETIVYVLPFVQSCSCHPQASCCTCPVCPVLLSSRAHWPVCFNQHYICQRAYLRRWVSLCVLLRYREDKAKWGAGELGHKCMPLIHTFSPIFMVLDPLVLKVKGALPGRLFNTNDSKITWPGPELSRFSTLNYILEQTLLFSNVKDI